ncbi:MAG: ABC transporter ATP-binding protein/permease [Mycobacteriaceae bacterium]|nr:ABC transporter ATP-binding protein/permease [Mycobacteriaceae bacterium]
MTETDAAGSAEDWRGCTVEESPIVESDSSRRASFRLVTSLVRPYRLTIFLLLPIVLVENAARLFIPVLIMLGIDKGVSAVQAGRSAHELMLIIGALGGVTLIQAATRFFFLKRSGQIRQQVLLVLRRRVFLHFQHLDLPFHDRYSSGKVLSRLTNDIDAIREFMEYGLEGLITAVLTLVGSAIMMIFLDLPLALVCIAAFPVLVALTAWFQSVSGKTYRKVRESAAQVIMQFVETMTGIRAIQAYRREPRNQQIFSGLVDQYRTIYAQAFRLLAVFIPGVKLVGNIVTGVVLIYGGWRVLHGDMTIGVLTAFLMYPRMFFDPVYELATFFNLYQSASSAMQKLAGVLKHQASIEDPANPVPLTAVRGEITFHDVKFAYTASRPLVPGLTLQIPAGQTVALVGTTGAGKTTIAKLLARFYDPTSGSVTLDGVDLRNLAQRELRRHVVMVTQENFMFSGTVADNIRFGRPDATTAEIRRAAEEVGADHFISALPDGYDTDIHKRGGRLSAGQRQLIALARAFLADPAVLILDEATAAMDIPSEQLVQHALARVLVDRTALVIAHRLSTVAIADRVVVLEQGKIVEDGPPRDLLREGNGRYAALHQVWEQSLA